MTASASPAAAVVVGEGVQVCTRCVQDEIVILNTFKALILLGFLIGVQDGKDKS